MQSEAPVFDQTKLLDTYDRLFAEAGWKELVEDLKGKRETVKEIAVTSTSLTERQLGIIQGQVSVWDYIISLENLIEQIRANQKEELPDLDNADQ